MRSLVILLLTCTPLAAQEVALELVLLADASGSIDQSEIDFQRQGYAEAMMDPEVLAAISDNLTGSIAVTYVEWAANQAVVVDWTIVDSAAAAQDFAEALLMPPRQARGRNAIGAALLAGRDLIDGNQITGLRRVIDFSGDSTRNFSGPSIADARDQVLAAGITINGLPILCLDCSGPSSSDLVAEYSAQIIGGPGAFVVAADGRGRFAEAVKRKLILEIADKLPSPPVDVRRADAGGQTIP